ncbi:LOW QUALITY PROTEIN: very-long-chain 3-oxoacyl-CoA reductase-like protein At1g24470 [Asparagus officinalis]|uniref:LOW QUALITY PROTEIN: very-long-chain 3-oxoacyl-CoA reductase-like protein At1g24470 n=1 Tax=Asparagus officinalis TaxID=4686 RepID=UPI00098E2A22|nr:LOW QUALITY PROTEIN: very-long-chain 3-oxoacyl-CoA reductase-like protein At1g24470 [Asparagus officinalis]
MEMVKRELEALTRVTRVYFEKGLDERKRRAGMNIGSGSSVVVPSFPLFSVYAGTKAYVQQLSKSMHIEYKSEGVHLQCQAPLYVHTRMAARAKGYYFFKPSPESYAKAAVHWIGYDSVCVPYFPHFLQWCLVNMLPDFINDYMCLTTNMGFLKKST